MEQNLDKYTAGFTDREKIIFTLGMDVGATLSTLFPAGPVAMKAPPLPDDTNVERRTRRKGRKSKNGNGE